MDQDPVVPLPRIGPESGRVRVVGVESEPLTAEQEAAAVRALSTLICGKAMIGTAANGRSRRGCTR